MSTIDSTVQNGVRVALYPSGEPYECLTSALDADQQLSTSSSVGLSDLRIDRSFPRMAQILQDLTPLCMTLELFLRASEGSRPTSESRR